MSNWLRGSLLFCVLLTGATSAVAVEPYRIERFTATTGDDKYYYTQARAALVAADNSPVTPARIILIAQQTDREGSHGYRDLLEFESRDDGKTWSEPRKFGARTLRGEIKYAPVVIKLPDGKVMNAASEEWTAGDLTPAWHAKSKTVLATGKTFTFVDGKEDRLREQVSYLVYKPADSLTKFGTWSREARIVVMPPKDHAGFPIVSPNAGCTQRVDLPDGDVLLPIRYRRKAEVSSDYTTIVGRCKFDGKTLTYVEHGSELHHTNGRGFGEPSLAKFGDRYFLTIRNEAAGYVARSDDGLNYSKPIQWTYDDGTPLPTYNTQQHWVAHEAGGLYLVYTRRGAGNDHIFRHRAPLFIARVDPDKLQLIKSTEQILLPHDHADLGNFGVTVVSPSETWVVAGEGLQLGARNKERNKVLVAKILWNPSAR